MAKTGWFIPGDDVPRRPVLRAEVMEGPESEAGGSSAPIPNAGGTNHIYVFMLSQFSIVHAYCYVLTD